VLQGPRIYNLFPTLAGPIEGWGHHLDRVQAMGFDWVWLNPVHTPGASGSLYAIADLWHLNPALRNGADADDQRLLAGFVEDAHGRGLKVMLDLVVRYTARDARLVTEHPDWFRRDANGELHVPRAADGFTLWHDLAEVDWRRPEIAAAAAAEWREWVSAMVRLGVDGFRCVSTTGVPAAVWSELVAAGRSVRPDLVFVADVLGAPVEQVRALKGVGFDYLFSSAKWWDLRSEWYLEQQRALRDVAPTIAFPESHDTRRVAAEAGTDDPEQLAMRLRFAYMAAATVGTGVMVPIGFEYGFAKRLDPAATRPEDWEEPRVDLTGFIAAANAMKAAAPALNVEVPLHRATAPQNPLVGLVRADGADMGAVALLNPDPAAPHAIDPGPILFETGGRFDRLEEVTPGAAPGDGILVPGRPVELKPLEVRVFRGLSGGARSAADPEGSRQRLARLAGERVAIEGVSPEIDGGRFPVKRAVGDVLEVSADIFGDGHDKIAARLLWREADRNEWHAAPMEFLGNDRWVGRVPLTRNTRYLYTIEAWRDPYATWRNEVVKKRDAGQPVRLEIIEGRRLLDRMEGGTDPRMRELAAQVDAAPDETARLELLLGPDVQALMTESGPRDNVSRYGRELEVVVDRTAARFSAWYEMFPRSAGPGLRHGTFDDVIKHLPYVRDMGFDVLYFPPIHPIGTTKRKGRNNALVAQPGEPGSPYAIGSPEGGHDAVHPELGTLEDFRRLVKAAEAEGLEIAIDFAIQCSPDHPWIQEHPEWFEWRPDGSIRHAENPPKKYEDIVNVHFYDAALPSVWYALRDVVLFWAQQGVRIFRVDNPHTKPLPFWEWMIREVQTRYPDTIFLSEAFTRPRLMYRLAKLGFTQSYSYFTWRNRKQELVDYLTELTQDPPKDFYRPNFFVNTPDINPPYLQTGGRAAHQVRVVLAGTLSGVYGVYSGFELCEATPVPGKEEYLNAEKYEIKDWDFDRPGNIRDYITRLNRIRRDNPALHAMAPLAFMPAHDDNVLFYGKATPSGDNCILVLVNLDPHQAHGCWIEMQLERLGLPGDGAYRIEELFSGDRFTWHGRHHHVHLDPNWNPCMILRVTPG